MKQLSQLSTPPLIATLILLLSACGGGDTTNPDSNSDDGSSASSAGGASDSSSSGGATSSSSSSSSSSGSTSSSSGSTSTSSGGVVFANDFNVTFSDGSPQIFDEDHNYRQTEIDVTITAESRNDIALLAGTTVTFRTEWGSFLPTANEGATCQLNSAGQCSVKWRSGHPSTVPPNCFVAFTAYTIGEEDFTDVNDNKVYDDADDGSGTVGSGFIDIEEPFLPTFAGGHVGAFNPGDQVIDVLLTNGIHDAGDGLYNGASCAHSQLCGPVSTIVWDYSFIKVKADPSDTESAVCSTP